MAEDERKDIGERLVKIETLLELNYRDLFGRVKKLEDSQSWQIKAIIGAIIAGAIGLYFK